MSGARSRMKGNEAERAVVRYLRSAGYQLATTSRNAHDGLQHGEDIIGVPGVSLEVKNRRGLEIGSALTQATIAGGPGKIPVVIAKPYGVGLDSVGSWWAMTWVSEMVQLFPKWGEL
jgi:hypothetical protein